MDFSEYFRKKANEAKLVGEAYVDTATTGKLPLSPEEEYLANLSLTDRLNRFGDQMHDKMLPNDKPRAKPMALYKEQFGPMPATFAENTPPSVTDRQTKEDEETPPAKLGKKSEGVNRKPASLDKPVEEAQATDQVETSAAAPSTDEELDEAHRRRNLMQMLAGLGKAGIQAGEAISGTSGSSTQGLDLLHKAGEQEVSDLLQKRDQAVKALEKKKKEYDLQDDAAMAKPESSVSQTLRDGYEMVTGKKLDPSVSGAQLRATGVNLGMLISAKLQADSNRLMLEQRKEGKQDRKDLKDREFEAKIDSKLEKLDQKFKESTTYIDQANAQIELATKNPQAATNLARNIIKAVEGAGARVSDKDFTSAIGDKSAAGRLVDTINGLATGTIRKATQKDLNEMIAASEKVMKQKHNESRDLVLKNYAKTSDRDLKEVRSSYGIQDEPAKTVKVKLSNGQTGTIPQENLEKAKERDPGLQVLE